MRIGPFMAAGLGVLLLAGAAAAAPPVIRPLSDIVAVPPRFAEIGAHSVTLLVDTSIPVACSAVYGETAAFGAVATDTDMAGGAHSHHHPLLGGLKPDTAYKVRVQGVGPDGTLYVSDVLDVRTGAEAAAAASPYGTNVALASAGARVVAVSSTHGGGDLASSWGGNRAIDGDPATEWSSNGDGDAGWIEIDLGQPRTLSAIGLKTRTMGSSAQIERFAVVTDSGERLGPFTLPDAQQAYAFPVSVTARTLRLEIVSSSGGNTGVGEIEAFAR